MTISHDDAVEDVLAGVSLYHRVGGRPTFARIVRHFFEAVRTDCVLEPMYAADPAGAELRLLLFLEQFWGGPATYSRTRGAPMLRMRHMAYKVSPRAREHWLAHMHAAISAVSLEPEDEFLMRDHVERAATHLLNADD